MIGSLTAFLACMTAGFSFTNFKARRFEQEHPNIGTLTDIGGYKVNALHIPASESADLPPLVFIHGASGNLLDQVGAFLAPLEGRAEMLFVDRPGHGYSERGGPENDLPSGQADAIALLMEKHAIDQAIIVGHSFGGAIAAAFGVRHPEKTKGLLFLAPASHPWPGGIDWYYHVSAAPFLGWLFNHLLVVPMGLARLEQATQNVFAPNLRPDDYLARTGPTLVLRPKTFAHNARDFIGLLAYFEANAPYYKTIKAPTVIVTGDSDAIVWEHLHAQGLARDIAGSQLVRLRGIGHKPDYLATDLAVAALEKIAGFPRDLERIARQTEQRVRQASSVPQRESVASGLPDAEVTTGAAPSSA
ncbi:alpha/beta fold hydrolase [Oryzifoliimicrobium ureilyticus]|uniref:alpha/beta fold hydrolase n=1 Tax=Oryzifoliimicrobium ureilyticus TaxID=3113724 RepID=UPI0030766E97